MATRLTTREHLLIFAFWTGLAIVSAVNRLLDAPGFMRALSPAGPVVLAFLEAWLWAGATPFIFTLAGKFPPERTRWWIRIPALLVIGVLLSVLIYSIIDVARDLLIEVPRPRRRRTTTLDEIARFRFVNELVFYLAVLAAGYAREYFLRDREREAQAERLRAQLAEARLNALRMQINPHFLFNTLHAISALVERDPAGVRKMISRLSELLRHTTDSGARDLIPLRDELEFLRRYIEIMEIRFQGRLQVSVSVEPETLEALVPNLILQPIVENAFEHGASRASGAGEIVIEGRRAGELLMLSVRDNGPGAGDSARNAGIGLSNTRSRLHELYGDRAGVDISSPEEGGALAEIVIPYTRADRG